MISYTFLNILIGVWITVGFVGLFLMGIIIAEKLFGD